MSSPSPQVKRLSLLSGPRPLQLPSTAALTSPVPSPTVAPHLSRSNSTSSPVVSSKRPIPKRLSSISYSTSASQESVATPTHPHSPALRSAPLDRPSSISGTSSPTLSQASPEDSRVSPAAQTLAEKHGDLLQFIAQKESKCLELRQQLEQHEAELKVLKRKWERIVSKSKPSPARSSGSGSVMVGDGMVGAIKDLGRLFGGLGGLDDLAAAGTSIPSPKVTDPRHITSSSPSLDSTNGIPVAEAKKPPASTSSLDVVVDSRTVSTSVDATPPSTTFPRSRPKRRHSPSSSSSGSSAFSNPTPSANSTRDSLSSVSTAASSADVYPLRGCSGDSTPTPNACLTGTLRHEPSTQNPSETSEPSLPPAGPLGWVPTGLNKTFSQLSKSDTFSRNSHRASLLLSDVTDISTTLLNSLTSVLSPPVHETTNFSPKQPSTSGSGRRCAQLPQAPASQSSDLKVSLLDGSEDEDEISRVAIPVTLQPSPSPSSLSLNTSSTPQPFSPLGIPKTAVDHDDEWNW